jgi:hypothetical protein
LRILSSSTKHTPYIIYPGEKWGKRAECGL